MLIAVNIILVLLLGMLQVSFFSLWPVPVSHLHIILTCVLFLAVIANYRQALWWAFGAGLFLELFSSTVFGLTTLALVLTVWLVNFLFIHMFTNRSLYSLLLLGAIGTIIYHVTIFVGRFIAELFNVSSVALGSLGQYVWFLLLQIVINCIVLTVLFFVFRMLSAQLKNNFIILDSNA